MEAPAADGDGAIQPPGDHPISLSDWEAYKNAVRNRIDGMETHFNDELDQLYNELREAVLERHLKLDAAEKALAERIAKERRRNDGQDNQSNSSLTSPNAEKGTIIGRILLARSRNQFNFHTEYSDDDTDSFDYPDSVPYSSDDDSEEEWSKRVPCPTRIKTEVDHICSAANSTAARLDHNRPTAVSNADRVELILLAILALVFIAFCLMISRFYIAV
ncbi:hypothetical protein F4821DRAFT_228572 [Hypoxylon rubiginosum]|uniref:Uncharacterized protein n=1 Tax=Hypoxylon rubiginosum TaxID=110542 RepID=A0ACC0DDC8_9PEZI|nr:hypothetical protein F4821DRAFT_228572 [Hypoxylon rubiginosum]